MREYGSNINLPSLDNLFSSEQERQDAKLEKIQILPLTELHPFRNHPFQVRDDDEMDKMVKKHPDIVFVAAHPGEYNEFMRHMERMKLSENYYLDVSGYGIFRHGMFRH